MQPAEATPARDVQRYLLTRGLRGFADGVVAATFAALLRARGFDERVVGWVITATLLGSAVAVAAVARRPDVLTPPRVLLCASALMVVTGVAFAGTGALAVLVPLAVVGPLNPSGGDVSAFLPAEQTLVAEATGQGGRTAAYARYSLAGAAGATAGALVVGPLTALGRRVGLHATHGAAAAPLLYAAIGVVVGVLYARIGRHSAAATSSDGSPVRPGAATDPTVPARLRVARRTVRELALVFALDSAGGGFVGTALVAAWLARRFGFGLGRIGLVLALASAASAASALVAPRLTRRFGLVETMVYTHLPANALCIAAGLAPNARLAVGLLVARALLSQLDVPARQAFVMSVVPPEERAAAAAFTNLPRSLAAASTPPLAGWLIHRSAFGWPLVVGGALKAVYDVVLLLRFRRLSTRA